MADEELEIVVEDEAPETVGDALDAAAAGEVKPPPAPKPVTDPEEGVDLLKKQLEASKAEAAANAARANAAEQGQVAAKTEVQQTQVQLVESAIGAAKQTIDALEVQLADAYAVSDFTAVAKLQTQVMRKTAEQLALENGLERLKAAPKPRPEPPSDPVEAFASSLTAPAGAWIRSHPQYVTDPRLNAQLAAAHNLAVAEGIALDTPDYFARVEGVLGVSQRAGPPQADTDTLSETAVATGGRTTSTPPPAAPARNGANGAPRTIRLTAAQVEAAAISGQTPQEYAKMLARIEREKMETTH